MAFHDDTKALTFDLFGTVLDLGGSLGPAIAEFLKRKGAPGSAESFWADWRYRQRLEQFQDTIMMLGHSGYLETSRRACVYTLALRGIPAQPEEVKTLMAAWQELSYLVSFAGDLLDRLKEVQNEVREGRRADLPALLPGLVDLLRRRLEDLRGGCVPLEDLLVAQRITRELADYRVASPAARAAAQLAAAGKRLRPGQRVRFLLLRGLPDVHAWDLPTVPDRARLDIARYHELLMRAASSLFVPFNIEQPALESWVESGVMPFELPAIELV